MAIPQHLDSFHLGKRIISPEVVIDKRTMEAFIYIRVIDAESGAVIETKSVQDELAYLDYVESQIEN